MRILTVVGGGNRYRKLNGKTETDEEIILEFQRNLSGVETRQMCAPIETAALQVEVWMLAWMPRPRYEALVRAANGDR